MHYSFRFQGHVADIAELEDFVVNCEAGNVQEAIAALRERFRITSRITLVSASPRGFEWTLASE